MASSLNFTYGRIDEEWSILKGPIHLPGRKWSKTQGCIWSVRFQISSVRLTHEHLLLFLCVSHLYNWEFPFKLNVFSPSYGLLCPIDVYGYVSTRGGLFKFVPGPRKTKTHDDTNHSIGDNRHIFLWLLRWSILLKPLLQNSQKNRPPTWL